MELTKSELQIMDVLWDAQAPMSRADILSQSKEKSWKDSSVHILLNGLLAKGVIREAGFVKRSKTYGRTFVPTLTREVYFATNVFSYRKKPQIVSLIAALLEREEVSAKQLEQIRMMVQERIEKMSV